MKMLLIDKAKLDNNTLVLFGIQGLELGCSLGHIRHIGSKFYHVLIQRFC